MHGFHSGLWRLFRRIPPGWPLIETHLHDLGMVKPQTSLAGCGDLPVTTFRCLLLIVRILVALCAGFRNLVYLCARVTAVFITKMVLALLDHLRADCLNIATKSIMASFGFGAGKCPRLQILFNG